MSRSLARSPSQTRLGLDTEVQAEGRGGRPLCVCGERHSLCRGSEQVGGGGDAAVMVDEEEGEREEGQLLTGCQGLWAGG